MRAQRPCLRPLTALVLLLAGGSASGAVGSWSSNGPGGGNVVALAGYEASPTTLWAAGRGGVFRTTSGGLSWARVEIGLPEALFVQDLAAASAAPVIFLSTSTRLFRSGNGGDLWVPLPTAWSGEYVRDISLRRASSTNLALATGQALYVSSDGGSSWSAPGAAVAPDDAAYAGVEYAADGLIYAGLSYNNTGVFGGALVLRSSTGGASWLATSAQPAGFFGIAQLVSSPVNAQRLFVTDGGNLQTSPNGGANWSTVALPATGTACGTITRLTPHPTAAAGLIIACANRGLLVSADASVASPVWQTFDAANGYSANGVDVAQTSAVVVHPGFPATASLWAGLQDGGLLTSSNGGTSWSAVNSGYQSSNIRALATHPVDTGGSAVFFAGYGDSVSTTRAIYKSADAGGSWNSATSGLNAEQVRALAIDPTTVDTDPLSAENFTVYAAGRSERIPAAGSKDGGLYKSTNAGASWTTIDNGIALVSGRPDMGTVRVIAPDPRSCLSPPVSGPCAIGSGGLRTLYAAGSGRPNLTAAGLPFQSARIYKSTDAGANWTASENGLPLPQDLDPGAPTNLAYMGGVAALAFDPGNTQTIYIGSFLTWGTGQPGSVDPTLANGVFKSTNGGATWVHASSGLPRYAGAGSSHWSVLALVINPANPQILYAGLSNLYAATPLGTVYKTTDGGASWNPAATGIAGQDVRALFIDPNDPTGDTIYAGTGGDGANPGGVYRSSNGGASWNSLSLGLPADAATALAMPRRAAGAPARILAGTSAGVWDYTAVPDGDADGAPTATENSILAGDGNADGMQDSTQPRVASLEAAGLRPAEAAQGGGSVTVAIQPGSCSQLNDVTSLAAALYPPDSLAGATSHDAHGLVSFSLPACAAASVRVTFHGATFDSRWSWRNYGPRVPGDASTFGWYRYGGARRIDAQTWELRIDALRQGNYRDDGDDILFAGGPARSDDLIFSSGQE